MNKTTNCLICICLLILPFFKGFSQSNDIALTQLVSTLEDTYNITINYEVERIASLNVSMPDISNPLEIVFKNIEEQAPITFKKLSASVYYIEAYSTSVFCGYVLHSATKKPIEGAVIQYESSYAKSNKNGFFKIEKKKTSTISITHLGFETILQTISLSKINCSTFYLTEKEELLKEVLLTNYIVKGISYSKKGDVIIDYDDFGILPGQLENDVLQTLQALPGISSINETVANINIRGGSNDQNLILWDDIKMYNTGHFFGLISSFNPSITNKTQLIKNGTSAAYTDGVSGTILMNSSTIVNDSTSLSVGSTLLNTDIFVDIPFKGNASLQVAGRKALNDEFNTPIYKSFFDRITQDTEVEENESNILNSNKSFDFYDASMRYLHYLNDDDLLRVNLLFSKNELSFEENGMLANSPTTRNSFLNQQSFGAGIYYKKRINDNLNVIGSVYQTDYKLTGVNADILNQQRFLQENIVSETGTKIELLTKRNKPLNYRLGYNFIETKVTNLNDIDNPLFRRLFGRVLRVHSIFGESTYNSVNNNFNATFGIRGSYLSKFEKLIVEPRVQASYQINEKLSWQFAGEFKHQTTTQVVNFQNDFLGIERRRWQLSDNDEIPVIYSKQISTSLFYDKDQWLISMEPFYKYISGITTQSQGFQTKYEFTRAQGDYEALGIDLLARWQSNNISLWSSYSLLNATYYFDALEDTSFPSNFDINHTITAGMSYTQKNWKASTGINWHSGIPTSPLLQPQNSINSEIDFGAANSDRLPNYFRLDCSVLYNFKLFKSSKMTLGVSSFNTLNNNNIINRYYTTINENIKQLDQNALGFTYNLVAKVNF